MEMVQISILSGPAYSVKCRSWMDQFSILTSPSTVVTMSKKKFFSESIARHSRKLHQSYGGICIDREGDMDDFVNTQKIFCQ